jgi:tetratricopeptide (TPR) repeat protein
MDNPNRSLRANPALASFILLLILCVAAPVPAALAARQQEDGATESGQSELSKKEEKERAKQARIEEYLRKKEERLAAKELRQAGKEQQRQVAVPVEQAAPEQPAAEKADTVRLPRELARAQALLRQNEISKDPTVAEYLDLIDRAEASPHQLAAFGNFLSDLGMNRLALEYYAVALSIERDDPVLWINSGTLHRQVGDYSAARSDYHKALSIDPNLAVAHYNLGAVLDQQGNYEGALQEYRVALTLDPSLGDPTVNPQAANNEALVAVKLMLYQEKIGNLGLPLVEVPGGELASPQREDE